MGYEKRKKFIINFLYIALIICIVYATLQYFVRLLYPFILAFVIAYLIRIPARFISNKGKVPYKLVSLILVLLFYCIIGVLISLLGIKLFSNVREFIFKLPYIYTVYIESFLVSVFNDIEQAVFRMDPALVSVISDFFYEFSQSLGNLISSVSTKTVSAVSEYASSLPGMFIKTLLMVISTFFIAVDYDKLMGFVLRQFSGKGKELVLSIKNYIVGTLLVCIRSYALIMSITFIELSIGFTIIGIPRSILIALIISMFDVLPVLGTGGIMIPWAAITALQGNYKLSIGLMVIYLVVTIIRNIIEPKIVGSQIGLHSVVTLICMFVGAQLFGIIGLFGFPIMLSLLVHLNANGTIKLFK